MSTLVIANLAVDDGERGTAAGADTADRAEFNALPFEALGHPIPLQLHEQWASSFDKAGRARTDQAAVLGRRIKVKQVIKTGRSPHSAIGQLQMPCDLAQMGWLQIANRGLASIQDFDQPIRVGPLAVEIVGEEGV